MKKTIFLSDAHLDGKNDGMLPGLVEFLRSLTGKTSALYIGGDFFDFWMGDNPLCIQEYRPLLEVLRELKDAGTTISYVEGNHDFFLGKTFTEVIGARVFPGECVATIDGKTVYLAHGDLIDERDYGYRIFRALVHNAGVLFLSKILPPSWVWRVARLFSRKSRNNRRSHTSGMSKTYLRMSKAFRRFAEKKFAEGFDVVILAHIHAAEFKEYTSNGRPRQFVSMGGWLSGQSYLEYHKGRFIHRQWKKNRSRFR